MNTEQAFLSDIRAHPDHDTPRLIYADWLDEHSESPRAEFIRVQIELTRIAPTDDRVPELHLRQLQLLAEHEREWLGPWADRLVRWQFQRGMLHEVTIEPEPFVDSGNDLLASHPVHTIAFVDSKGESLAPDAITGVLAVPHIGLVRGLELSGCRPTEDMAGMFGGEVHTNAWLLGLAAASHITCLETINLPGCTRAGRGAIEPRAMAAFCASPHLASLRSLDLSDVYWSDDPHVLPALCDRIASSTFAFSLRRLSLAQCPLTDDALAYLTLSAGLRGLEAVNFAACDLLGADGLRAFLASRPSGRLRDLCIPYGLNLQELGSWPGLRDVQTLVLAGSSRQSGERGTTYADGRVARWTPGRNVGPEEWLSLFLSPNLSPTRLTVNADNVPDDGIAELFSREWISKLRAFALITSYWGRQPEAEIIAALLKRDTPWLHEVSLPWLALLPRDSLAAWPVLSQLTQLSIGNHNKDSLATWLLSSAPLTTRVSSIHLTAFNGNEEAVAQALAGSPWSRGITHLNFGYNNLTPSKIACLASAPFARYLESLHLGSERGEDALEALKAIADDRNFPRLRDVVVGSDTVEGGIEVLQKRFKSRLRVFSEC